LQPVSASPPSTAGPQVRGPRLRQRPWSPPSRLFLVTSFRFTVREAPNEKSFDPVARPGAWLCLLETASDLDGPGTSRSQGVRYCSRKDSRFRPADRPSDYSSKWHTGHDTDSWNRGFQSVRPAYAPSWFTISEGLRKRGTTQSNSRWLTAFTESCRSKIPHLEVAALETMACRDPLEPAIGRGLLLRPHIGGGFWSKHAGKVRPASAEKPVL
jgi:hypothetical protein